MKVLAILSDGFGGHGGIAHYNRCLTKALSLQACITEVFCLQRLSRFPVIKNPEKIRSVTAFKGNKWVFGVLSLFQIVKSWDLVICGHIHLLPLAVVVGKLKRVPVVLQVHGIEVWSPTKSSFRWLKYVDAIWSVSAFTRDKMNVWAKQSPTKYTIIPNTIKLESYQLSKKRQDLLDRFRISDSKIVVTMGRLAGKERAKGFDEIMESFPDLIKVEPTLNYLIIGDGDDELRLKKKAAKLGIAERVHFTGYVSEDEKADYLSLGDVFAMPGKGEGFGIVYLEAMACGIPVVGSQLDGSQEALRGGMLGELVNPDDPASLQNGILKALKKPKEVPQELEYFDWLNYVQRIEQAVEEIAPKKKKQV